MNSLIVRPPGDLPGTIDAWAGLSTGERKRRAMHASMVYDLPTLLGLLHAYTLTRGHKGATTSPRTLEVYAYGATRLLSWAKSAGRMLHTLTEDDGARWRATFTGKPQTGRAWLAGGRAMLRALTWAGAGTPTLGATSVYDGEDVGEKVRPWSDAELAAMLASCDTPELESLILLAADAGLRLAEVCALVWDDVNLTDRTLTVRLGKGGTTATLPMSLRLTESLRRSKNGTVRVIPHTHRDVQRAMDSLIVRAGVEKRGRGYHALRHTAGTRAARVGGVLAAQRLLRHRNLNTIQIYARLADDELRDVVETMGET